MNKLYALLLLFPTVGAAQPIITAAMRSQLGDVCPRLICDDVAFDLSAGENQVWDLSALPFTPHWTLTYVEASSAPGFALFPEATLAVDYGWGLYEFIKADSSGLEELGMYVVSDDWYMWTEPRRTLVFPCTYGTTWSDTVIWSTNDSPEPHPDTLHWEAFGYGTLLLPGHSVSNVLGVEVREGTTETIDGHIIVTLRREILLYAQDVHCSLAWANTFETWVDGVPYNSSYEIRVLDPATIGMAEVGTNDALEIWPMPAHGSLNLRWPGKHGTVDLHMLDVSGRMVREQQLTLNDATVALDIEDLKAGTYLLRIADEQGHVLAQRITVE